eukprot:COSAG04_NODE_21014_length_382_cov_0.381625_1_plen_57_part_01
MHCYNRWGLRHLVWFVVSYHGNLRYYGLSLVLGPFFKQKTAYEILRSDWSSDVCSSD